MHYKLIFNITNKLTVIITGDIGFMPDIKLGDSTELFQDDRLTSLTKFVT